MIEYSVNKHNVSSYRDFARVPDYAVLSGVDPDNNRRGQTDKYGLCFLGFLGFAGSGVPEQYNKEGDELLGEVRAR